MQEADPRVGHHGMFVLRNVAPALLEQAAEVRKRLWSVAKDCRLNVVAETGHQFLPVGVTHVLVLSESHLSIHTYPETGRAYVDLFTCVVEFDMSEAVLALKRHFGEVVADKVADSTEGIQVDMQSCYR